MNEDLRRRAEKLLQDQANHREFQDIAELIHELEVHQVELELQNNELRRAQIEIDTLRQRYMDLYLLAPVGYLVIDGNGKIIDLNLTASQMLQHERRYAGGSVLSRYLHAETRPQFYDLLNTIKTSPLPQTIELTLINQQTPPQETYVRVTAQAYQEDEMLRARLTMTDITEHVLAERHLRESEAKHRDIAENLPGMIFQLVMQKNGQLTFTHLSSGENSARDFAFSPEKIIADASLYFDAIVPGDLAQYREVLRQSAREMSNYSIEFRLRASASDEVIWMNARATPRRRADGSVMWTGIAINITERKQAESALKQLTNELEQRVQERTAELALINKELEAFNYSVSHDLRAPLRALDGYSLIILEDYADQLDDQAQEHLQRIRNASQHMSHLIDSLLNLSRISRQGLQRKPINLSNIAYEIINELQINEPERTVTCTIQDDMRVHADADLLYIVIRNLLHNAWKFTSKQAEAHIEFGTLTRDDKRWYFVRDDGVGFDMDYSDKLFSPFQRLHTRSQFEGTGIGLATVQRIIHRHGGDVDAHGQPDEGATFYFSLG